MALSSNNQNLQDLVSIQAQLLKNKDLYDAMAKAAGMQSSALQNALAFNTKINKTLGEAVDLEARIGKEIVQRSVAARIQGNIKAKEEELNRKIIQQELILKSSQKQQVASLQAARQLVSSLSQQNDQLTDQLKNLNAQSAQFAQIQGQIIKNTNDINNAEQQINGILKDQDILTLDLYKHQQEFLNQTRKITDDLEKRLVRANARLKGTNTILEAISKLPFGKEIKQAAKAIKDFGITGAIVIAAISAWVKLIKEVYEYIIGTDKSLTNIANNLGISKAATNGLRTNFEYIARATIKYSDNLDAAFLSITNQLKATEQLQASFETNVLLTNSMVQNQILLTKQMGFQEDEAASIQKLALTNNKTAEQTLQTIIKQNNSVVSYRKIIREVVKASGEMLANYKNSPEQLAKAVVLANKLGITLEETKTIASSLLNFESSISGELEAELLTGKQLNFERARAYALEGKTAEASADILKQFGSLNELMKLNVIQRESIAKSVGLTTDQLIEAAKEQQVLTQLGFKNKEAIAEQLSLLKKQGKQAEYNALQEEIRRKENGEVMLSQISQISLAQRFEESVERIKEIFVSIVQGPMGQLLEKFAKFLSDAKNLQAIVESIGAALGMLTGAAVGSIFGPVGTIVGAVLGGLGGASFAKGSVPVSDSVINPSGRITISTPEGMIVPDRKDHIITTTDPNGLVSGGRGNSKGLENKLDQLIYVISKGGNVELDSVKVGTTQAKAYSAYA